MLEVQSTNFHHAAIVCDLYVLIFSSAGGLYNIRLDPVLPVSFLFNVLRSPYVLEYWVVHNHRFTVQSLQQASDPSAVR